MEVCYKMFRKEVLASFELKEDRFGFEVEVTAAHEEYIAGEEFTADIAGRYLFGAPMADDRVSWTISLSPHWFTPPEHDGRAAVGRCRYSGNTELIA